MRIKPDFELTIEDIALATGGKTALPRSTPFLAFATSSKDALPGDLFIALDGERTTGRNYIGDATARGAYTLSEDKSADICVCDVRLALLDIVKAYKKRLKSLRHTVAVTGSVGKTTTKNMLSDFLGSFFKAHATEGNYNNYLGVFHTVMTAPRDTEALVCEIGMNHSGEISPISRALSPDVAVITNVGTAHIGNLGSRKKIAEAKLEICEGLGDGVLIIPFGETLLSGARNSLSFSIDESGADYSIVTKEENKLGVRLDIFTKSFTAKDLFVSECGRHILSALIISVAVLNILGISEKNITERISDIKKSYRRGRYLKLGELEIYDDTYSSSYEAVISCMRTLSLTERKRSCVLGDMLELGDMAAGLHREIGFAAVKYGFNKVFAFGKYADFIKEGAILGGLKEENIFVNTYLDKPYITASEIKKNCEAGEIVLVKASHNTHAERIYEFLI